MTNEEKTLPTAEEYVEMLANGHKFSEGEERFAFIEVVDPEDPEIWGINVYHVFPDGSHNLVSQFEEHSGDCARAIAWYDETHPGAWSVYKKQVERNLAEFKESDPEKYAYLFEAGSDEQW